MGLSAPARPAHASHWSCSVLQVISVRTEDLLTAAAAAAYLQSPTSPFTLAHRVPTHDSGLDIAGLSPPHSPHLSCSREPEPRVSALSPEHEGPRLTQGPTAAVPSSNSGARGEFVGQGNTLQRPMFGVGRQSASEVVWEDSMDVHQVCLGGQSRAPSNNSAPLGGGGLLLACLLVCLGGARLCGSGVPGMRPRMSYGLACCEYLLQMILDVWMLPPFHRRTVTLH